MKQNILITGGFGLLGSNLYKFLVDKKYNVFILDKKKNFLKKNYLKVDKKKVFLGDYLNKNYVKKIITRNKINVIFHTGAVTQVLLALKDPEYTYNNNIIGTLNFLEIIRKINKKIIFIYSSSDKAYGEVGKKSYKEETCLNSIFPYDVSKSCSDLICQSYAKTYNLKIGILRCGNLYGPGDFNTGRLINGFIISKIKNKQFIIRSNGKLVRDYLYVGDAVNAYYLTMKVLINKKENLRVYNVGSKYNLNVLDMTNKVSKIVDNKKANLKILNSSKNEISFQKLNFTKIKKELNWSQKVDLNIGLKKTIEWYKTYINLF
ncbi:GDP-mannose 4,6-dehydratase [Candidatus Pelagibacter sp. Uisw_113]|uniref:GDP-mannose 4,6-dehydratase n=1 Tax=Candidatus Pelagibacter sp. Uisw_113 TaxID=3230994 RepID=UPI0039ED5A82